MVAGVGGEGGGPEWMLMFDMLLMTADIGSSKLLDFGTASSLHGTAVMNKRTLQVRASFVSRALYISQHIDRET